jgi:hypothetical protein
MQEPRSRQNAICNNDDGCGCWFDILVQRHSVSSLVALLNNRTAALVQSMGNDNVSYAGVQPQEHMRLTLYNVLGDAGKNALLGQEARPWCAPHCDSPCNGEPIAGGMVAVATVTCKVPDIGGAASL